MNAAWRIEVEEWVLEAARASGGHLAIEERLDLVG